MQTSELYKVFLALDMSDKVSTVAIWVRMTLSAK